MVKGQKCTIENIDDRGGSTSIRKNLLIKIKNIPFLRVEIAKHGINFCHLTHNASRIQKKSGERQCLSGNGVS